MTTRIGKFRYHGEGWALFGLVMVNAVLTVITVGIYSFWAKNKVREYHYAHTEFDGDPFKYHGTGGELFVGALKAGGIMLVLSLALVGVRELTQRGIAPPVAQLAVVPAVYLTVLVLTIVAVNGARRYRLSRSSWRGVRFSFQGRARSYLALIAGGTLLSIVTLGFYTPWFQSRRRAFFIRNARFGSEPFVYDGKGGKLLGEYMKALVLTLPTLGLSWIWYAAFKHRYLWNHTGMRGARFSSSVTGGELLALWLTNGLLLLLTLGIGMPWAITRAHAFWCGSVTLHGTVDFASIEKRNQRATATAEGLADALDVGVGFAG
jgi:uncharacterized membrane protein YjgN (DUF898 family)